MATHTELFQAGHEKLKARDVEGARALFLQAAQAQGLDLQAKVAAGQAQLAAGDVEESNQTFLEVFDANPTEIDALLGLARGALLIGQPEDAGDYLIGVFHMEPENGEAHLYQGLVCEASGDLQQANDLLSQAVKALPDEYLAHFNHGRVLGQLEQHKAAVAALSRATELEPKSYDAYYALGTVCRQAGMLRESIVAFNQCLELAPDNVDIYATLADVLCAARDLDMAADVLNAGLNHCDEHPGLLQKAAAVASQAGLIGAAVGYMEKVVEKLPNYHQAWINLALYYILIDEAEKSEAAAKRAIEIDPTQWEGYYHLGNLYEAVRLFDQAVEQYRLAIEHSPEAEYRPELNLAAVLIEMDDDSRNEDAMGIFDKFELTREAMEILAPLTRRSLNDWRPHYNLALAHGKLGETNPALQLLDELLENEPEGTDLYDAAAALRENVFSTSDAVKRTQAISSLAQLTHRVGGKRSSDDDSEDN